MSDRFIYDTEYDGHSLGCHLIVFQFGVRGSTQGPVREFAVAIGRGHELEGETPTIKYRACLTFFLK